MESTALMQNLWHLSQWLGSFAENMKQAARRFVRSRQRMLHLQGRSAPARLDGLQPGNGPQRTASRGTQRTYQPPKEPSEGRPIRYGSLACAWKLRGWLALQATSCQARPEVRGATHTFGAGAQRSLGDAGFTHAQGGQSMIHRCTLFWPRLFHRPCSSYHAHATFTTTSF